MYSKEELLTFYINTVPFGEAIFGLDAASDRYFSKKAEQLTIEECALLVGLLKATGYYNPRNFPERALNRRNVVLHQMMVNGVIDSLTLDSLKQLTDMLVIPFDIVSRTYGEHTSLSMMPCNKVLHGF